MPTPARPAPREIEFARPSYQPSNEREREHREWARTLSEPITARSPALTVAALQALGDMSEAGEALEWLDGQG